MRYYVLPIIALYISCIMSSCANRIKTDPVLASQLDGHNGTIVLVNCADNSVTTGNPALAEFRTAPCSTFKIWNTLIGAELELIENPDADFYQWDGIARTIPNWNRDLTLRESFQYSCVPAFQILAARIGEQKMQLWIHRIKYGDMDISSGIDGFWLPAPGKKTILISPLKQARLLARLQQGALPFSNRSVTLLRTIMLAGKTERGTMYGKTGSGSIAENGRTVPIGWYTGFIESRTQKYAFACLLVEDQASGVAAKRVVEATLRERGLW